MEGVQYKKKLHRLSCQRQVPNRIVIKHISHRAPHLLRSRLGSWNRLGVYSDDVHVNGSIFGNHSLTEACINFGISKRHKAFQ